MLYDTNQPISVVIRSEVAVVFLCGEKISARVRFSRGWGFNRRDFDTILPKIRP
jgi:hypothetical protein